MPSIILIHKINGIQTFFSQNGMIVKALFGDVVLVATIEKKVIWTIFTEAAHFIRVF
jgi:hypothetical protein